MTANIIKLFEMVLLLGAGALSSCSKSDGGDAPGTGTERPCIFSAVTETSTKTSYSGVMSGSSERINWAVGDTVRIYSPQAYLHGNTGSHFDDYRITQVNTPEEGASSSSGTLASLSGNGLVWAGGSNTHYFYSVYPSPSTHGMSGNVDIAADSDNDNGVKISATIPATQTPSSWRGSETGTLTGAPDMRYAYMVASSSVEAGASTIPMSYTPWFTAFQIEIGTGAFGANDGSVTIDSFTLSTSDGDDALAGKFTLTGTAGSISAAKGQSTSNSVTLTVNKTIKGRDGKLVLTVFTLPIDHTQITLTFTGPEIGTRSLDLKRSRTWLNFGACKKIKITGLSLPENKFDTGGEDISWGTPPFGGPFTIDGTTYYLSNGDLYLATVGSNFASSTFGLYKDPFYSVMNNYGKDASEYATQYANTAGRSYFNWTELGSLFSTAAVGESNTTSIDNKKVPTGIASGCKVPTQAQWAALTTTSGRTGSTVNGTSTCKYAKVHVPGKVVNDIDCGNALVLFPDGVSITISESLTFNTTDDPFKTTEDAFTSISASTYSTLLAAGCVVLPLNGLYIYYGRISSSSWDKRGSLGGYWSSTAYSDNQYHAHILHIDSRSSGTDYLDNKDNFLLVRLLLQN